MMRQRQTVFGGGDEGAEPGNCFAACVATLLDLELAEVPNFVALPENESWWLPFSKWCLERGLVPLRLEPSGISWAYNALIIANGQGPRGRRHSVCWLDDAMVWDPHPSDDGLVEDPDGYVVFLPVDPAKAVCW